MAGKVTQRELDAMAKEFEDSRKILTAIGDEVRQHLLLVMIQSSAPQGMRVHEIAARTNLSRPAVSHHLQIMKDAGLLSVRREGTKNYYYFDGSKSIRSLIRMLEDADALMGKISEK